MSTTSFVSDRPATDTYQTAREGRGRHSSLPLTTRFVLGNSVTDEQKSFLDENGFLVFERVLSSSDIEMITGELDRIGKQWLAEKRENVFGIPLLLGKNEAGTTIMHRYPYI